MHLSKHERVYNLTSWGHIDRGAKGAVCIHLPTVRLDVYFDGTTEEHPVSLEVLAELITLGQAYNFGTVTWEEFERLYRAVYRGITAREDLTGVLTLG